MWLSVDKPKSLGHAEEKEKRSIKRSLNFMHPTTQPPPFANFLISFYRKGMRTLIIKRRAKRSEATKRVIEISL